jgi:DnaJ-class molecular chaperone
MKCPSCGGKGFLRTLQPIEPERLVFEDILGGFSSIRIVGEIVAVPCNTCHGRGKISARERSSFVCPPATDPQKSKPLSEWLDEMLDHGYNEE